MRHPHLRLNSTDLSANFMGSIPKHILFTHQAAVTGQDKLAVQGLYCFKKSPLLFSVDQTVSTEVSQRCIAQEEHLIPHPVAGPTSGSLAIS